MEQNASTYLFLSSADSQQFFPDNSAADFRIKLDIPIILDAHWHVCLCEITFKLKSGDNSKSLSVYSSICRPSYIDNHAAPILRRITRKGAQEFMSRQYFPIARRYIESLDIYIRNEQGEKPLFADKPIELTLHLKRSVNHHFL